MVSAVELLQRKFEPSLGVSCSDSVSLLPAAYFVTHAVSLSVSAPPTPQLYINALYKMLHRHISLLNLVSLLYKIMLIWSLHNCAFVQKQKMTKEYLFKKIYHWTETFRMFIRLVHAVHAFTYWTSHHMFNRVRAQVS